jgi:hypothetical protein
LRSVCTVRYLHTATCGSAFSPGCVAAVSCWYAVMCDVTGTAVGPQQQQSAALTMSKRNYASFCSFYQTNTEFTQHTVLSVRSVAILPALRYSALYLLTYLITYLFYYFLTYLLSYLLTFLLTYLLSYFLTYLVSYLLSYLLTYFLTYLLTYLLPYFITFLLTYLLTFLLLTYLLTFLLT